MSGLAVHDVASRSIQADTLLEYDTGMPPLIAICSSGHLLSLARAKIMLGSDMVPSSGLKVAAITKQCWNHPTFETARRSSDCAPGET